MKVSLERDPLNEALQQLHPIVEKKSTVAILSNILCWTENSKVSFFATDLEVGLRIDIPGEIKEQGRITLAAKNFSEIIKELPEGSVHLSTKKNHWIELISNKVRFDVVGLSADDFPALPDFVSREYFKANREAFLQMIEKTAFAVSTDATRYHLNGVYLEAMEGGKMRMTATDGHRLSFIDQKIFEKDPAIKKGTIIPKKGLLEIKKLLESSTDSVQFSFEKGSLFCRTEDRFLSVRLMDGEYPDYKQVIPKALDKEAGIHLEDLQGALRRVSLLSHEKTKGVKLYLQPGLLTISSSNPDLGEAREEIDADYSGEAVEIGFNAKYLLDCLSVMKGKVVQLKLKDKQSPGLLQTKELQEHTYIIMPMRLP